MTPAVTRPATFAALASSGMRANHGVLRISHLPAAAADVPELDRTGRALAFALSRRFGNAVERNRARRRLRAAFEMSAADAPPGAYLIGAQRGVLTAPFAQLVHSLHRCFERFDQERS